MDNNSLLNHQTNLAEYIFTIREKQVMIDRDLAELYQISTKALNQAVKRNANRFPENFRFQLSEIELNELVTKCDRFKILKHSSIVPSVFTEFGVAMLPSILKNDMAVMISIQIITAFVEMRKSINYNGLIDFRLDKVEHKQLLADKKFEQIFKELEKKELSDDKGVFFEGQIFDAYTFINNLIRKASTSIILIDNYIDDTVLTMFSKKNENVNVTIYTKSISKQLALDLVKFNAQYSSIEIKILTDSHDRFLIIDETDLYHIGASIKDLGKKWFGFSKMNMQSVNVLKRLQITV